MLLVGEASPWTIRNNLRFSMFIDHLVGHISFVCR